MLTQITRHLEIHLLDYIIKQKQHGFKHTYFPMNMFLDIGKTPLVLMLFVWFLKNDICLSPGYRNSNSVNESTIKHHLQSMSPVCTCRPADIPRGAAALRLHLSCWQTGLKKAYLE